MLAQTLLRVRTAEQSAIDDVFHDRTHFEVGFYSADLPAWCWFFWSLTSRECLALSKTLSASFPDPDVGSGLPPSSLAFVRTYNASSSDLIILLDLSPTPCSRWEARHFPDVPQVDADAIGSSKQKCCGTRDDLGEEILEVTLRTRWSKSRPKSCQMDLSRRVRLRDDSGRSPQCPHRRIQREVTSLPHLEASSQYLNVSCPTEKDTSPEKEPTAASATADPELTPTRPALVTTAGVNTTTRRPISILRSPRLEPKASE